MARGVRGAMTAPTPELEVRKVVRPAPGERYPMVNLEPVRPAAADADTVTGTYLVA